MLEHEVTIQQDGFDFGQKGVVAVEVGPASLHHPNLWVGKVMDGAQQKIFRRSKVGVENRNKLAPRRLQSFGERARLVAFAIRPVMVGDGIAQRRVTFDEAASHIAGFVSRVVEYL